MNKKTRIRFHKIVVLCNALLIELDDMKPTAPQALELQQKAKEFEKALEPFLESAFESKILNSSTYLNELCTKIDTVIRKNYELISE